MNITGDAVDSNPGDRLCQTRGGFCSLRAAVQETNALPGADVITLPAGFYPLTAGPANENNALSGDLDIRDDLVIRGAGAGLTRITGAKNLSRVFSIFSNDVNANPIVSIEQLAMGEGLENVDGGVVYTEGTLSLSDVWVEDAGFKNAAVYAIDTRLNIEDSVFQRNNISVSVLRSQLNVSNSQFKQSQFTSGAPILINNSVAQISDSVFSDNQGSGGSGAISAINSKAVISNSEFTDNRSAGTGSGAVSLDTGTYSLKSNVFSGNTSSHSGGAIGSNAATYIVNNTFKGNVSGSNGGAIEIRSLNRVSIIDSLFDANDAADDCGAISIQRDNTAELLIVENSIFRNNISGNVGGALCFDNNVKVSHSEFTGNVSRTKGGAIYSYGNSSRVVNSTISGNLAVSGSAIYQKTINDSKLDLHHVTIVDNVGSTGNTASIVNETGRLVLAGTIVTGKGSDAECVGKIETSGYNFSSDNSCNLTGQGDISSATALLGDLVPYGLAQGSTAAIALAHIPASGSPVLHKVPTSECPLLDQAYKNRSSVSCDIGAVQLNGTDVLRGIVKFSKPTYQVSELDVATINVSRVDGDYGAIGVHFYDTEQGTAVSGTDYEVVRGGYLEWADGDTTDKLIEFIFYNDNSKEGTETIQLALAGVSGGAAIGGVADTAIVSIIDDETNESVTITEEEGNGAVGTSSGQTTGSTTGIANSTAGSTTIGTTAGIAGDVTGGTTGAINDGPIFTGGANMLDDESDTGTAATAAATEPVPDRVITGGNARAGGGSFSVLILFVLLMGVGLRSMLNIDAIKDR